MNENAASGVDYTKIIGFKNAMCEVAKRTKHLPEAREVRVFSTTNGHAGAYNYFGKQKHMWVVTKEGLGNKAWIAMYMDYIGGKDPTGNYYFGNIGIDATLMGANDNGTHCGLPVILTDEVSCGSDDFFSTPQAMALAASFEKACFMTGCALVQGESPAYKYLMRAMDPVSFAPSLSVGVTGIIAPNTRFVNGERVEPGNVLVGWRSSGLHANGISPVIKRVMALPNRFWTELNGRTVGEEALIATRSYIGLVAALSSAGVDIRAFVPMTGGGVGKFASDDRYHYKIDNWVSYEEMPPLFRFMYEKAGMTMRDLAETFNCGIGWAAIVPRSEVDKVLEIGSWTKIDGEEGCYDGMVLGTVQEGQPGTTFLPWNLHLRPPGE